MLPRYTNIAQPQDDVMEVLEYLVATMQELLGPLPVTDLALRKHPESYLSWLHMGLTEFQAAQGTPYAPKMFSMFLKQGITPVHQDQHNFIAQVIDSGNKVHEGIMHQCCHDCHVIVH